MCTRCGMIDIDKGGSAEAEYEDMSRAAEVVLAARKEKP